MTENNLKYGEELVMFSVRVPKSKKPEIKQIVKMKLNEYYLNHLSNNSEPLVEITEEIKSLDVVSVEEIAIEPAAEGPVAPAEVGKEPWRKVLAEQHKDPKYNKKIKPKPDPSVIANLKNIALGKSVPLDQLFNFEIVSSLPDVDDRIFMDKKGFVMFDKYNPSIFYVIHDEKYLMFTNKGELDKFCEQQGIVLI